MSNRNFRQRQRQRPSQETKETEEKLGLSDQIVARPEEQVPAPLPAAQKAPPFEHPDTAALRQVSSDIPRLEAALAEAKAKMEQEEQEEAERAKTPLALTLQYVSCQYANAHFVEGQTMPTYSFDHPCPFGKETPDQDCRSCAFVRLINYGEREGLHQKRYPHHGTIIPLKDEKEALKVAQMLNALEVRPLRRPVHEVSWLQRNLEEAQNRQKEIARRELERQQQGRF